jgi:acyl carrier protein
VPPSSEYGVLELQNLDQTIIAELRQLAAVRGLTLPAIKRRDQLVDDLGLKSLDLAHLVAVLERRLNADPFLRLVSITSIRTVGDLCDAYSRFFSEAQKKA